MSAIMGGEKQQPVLVHLVVLQHGLWGTPVNLKYMEETMHSRMQHLNVVVLNSDVNSGHKTYDGIDGCGERVVQLIKETKAALEAGPDRKHVKQISLIGYSLGGLMMRYAVGRLHAEHWFDSEGVQPMNFVTIATPHLGSFRAVLGAYNRLFNRMVPIVASRSGYQLMLADKHAFDRPLLMNMSDPELSFYKGLQRFKKLMLLANIQWDRMVPYCTASIQIEDPYATHLSIPINPSKYPSIVRPVAKEVVLQQELPNLRPLRGKWMPYAFPVAVTLCFPVVVGVLLHLSWTGKRHYAQTLQQTWDSSWLMQHFHHQRQQGKGGAGGPAVHKQDMPIANGVRGPTQQDLQEEEEQLEQQEQQEQQHQLQQQHQQKQGKEGQQQEMQAVSAVLEPADVQVMVAGDQFHEGIAVGPSTLHERQAWMVEALNKLPWHRVDVDCRHIHAHAAIVLRQPARFMQNKDVIDYLIDNLAI